MNIKEVCERYKIENWFIVDDKVNVNGDVYLEYKNLTSLNIFDGISFGEITGNFYCGHNNLTSLEYGPTSVDGDFSCSNNKLSSLQYAPTSVGGNLYCIDNNILDFKYFPNVGGNLYLNSQLQYLYNNYIKTKDNIQLFNEFDIIRGNKINLKRLNKFITQYGGNEVNTNKLKELGYELT